MRRGWDFVSTGRGDVPWEDCFRGLAEITPAQTAFDAAFGSDR